MIEIPLTRGMVTLIDDEDFVLVSNLKWSVIQTASKFYARHATNRKGVFRSITLHRLLMGNPEGMVVDHIDGDGLNNQRANLRIATQQQNAWNNRGQLQREAPYKGITTNNEGLSWSALIHHDGQVLYLGTYRSAEEAARIHDAAAVQLRDEFAWTNFPEICPNAARVAASVLAGNPPPKPPLIPRKLTDADVIEIRHRYAKGGELQRDLAEEFGVTTGCVGHAIGGRTFRHITDPAPILEDMRRRKRPTVQLEAA